MVESREDLELLNAMPVSVPEHEKSEKCFTLDSDGIVLLCDVCGDTAKGTGYGVYCCTACKFFFSRRLKTGYPAPPPCKNNQQCSMSPICLRNCADCRLKKCIALGMYRHCRTSRIHIQETKTQGIMQKANANSQEKGHLNVELDDEANAMPVSVPEHETREKCLTLDSDGIVLLCNVCGDTAKGTGYGAYCCAACQLFFHLRFKTGYPAPPPCKNNQLCSMSPMCLRSCADCRFKKCIAVGMVRYCQTSRIHIQEKIQGVMQKANASSQEKDHLNVELDDEATLIATIVEAYRKTFDNTKVVGRSQPTFTQSPPQIACLLNPAPLNIGNDDSRNVEEDFMERFEPAITAVIEFAKRIPVFRLLSPEDQRTLLKAGLFEVQLVRFACSTDCKPDLLMNPDSLRCRSLQVAEKMRALNMSETEISLFCAVVFITDRPGLRNTDLVLKLQKKIINILRKLLTAKHQGDSRFFNYLMEYIRYLKLLNIEHSKRLLHFEI